MKPIPRMVTVEPVIPGVLKISWEDGYEGVVDLRPVIARGNVFSYLESAEAFRSVKLGEYGHSIFWNDNRGDTIDFGSSSLRRTAEEQAAMHAVAS